MNRINLPARPRILVIALRRLGDVLLTTPLIRSLRRAWPDASIDALVFADTAGILQGNPDLNRVAMMPPRPSTAQSLKLAARLWRRYDLAISTQSGDRPSFFATVAGRARVGPFEQTFSGRLKGHFLTRGIPFVHGVHRVEENLRLADLIGIGRVAELVAPREPPIDQALPRDYAVIHAAPKFRYKQWTKSGWRAVAAALAARGIEVIATGGAADAERRYLDEVWSGTSVRRLDGHLDWPQLAGVLARARIYVGPDTSVTHLAAASGCRTVALYGPTDPRLWGPWPVGGLQSMWSAAGSVQNRGNVWLVQNVLPCTPCQLEGCERRLDSHSCCLDELSPRQVISVILNALG